MLAFLIGLGLLAGGYAVYGRFVASTVRPDPERVTPAVALADGVDYVAMPTWRVYLIQLLNIAGLGPVFGPIMGALWGPQVFLWVVFGTILGGGVQDFLAGAMSMRNNGAGLPELIGHYLGPIARHLGTFFILGLVVLVGTVFVKGPALLIASILPAEKVAGVVGGESFLTSTFHGHQTWLWIIMLAIFAYYMLATMLPIDKVIGRIYPIFAAALLIMAGGLTLSILTGKVPLPEFTLENLHPKHLPAWPIIFITVSCGAVSGFHSTQSPLMARCLKNEKHMRLVFYGAMVAEGFIALVWAASAQGFYGGSEGLAAALGAGGPGQVVHDICDSTMGMVGGTLAILGVVVLPITSGDTAFRVARLIVADYAKLPQERPINRYKIAVPLFAVSILLNFVDFAVVWRYFGWANQTLAAVALWTGAVFLARRGNHWWLAVAPAVFMTVVTTTYIMVEKHGLGLPRDVSIGLGMLIGAACLLAFMLLKSRWEPEDDRPAISPHPSGIEKSMDNIAS